MSLVAHRNWKHWGKGTWGRWFSLAWCFTKIPRQSGHNGCTNASLDAPTLVSWVNVPFQGHSHSTQQEVVLGKDLEFPDELPTDKGREAAANNIISPSGSDTNVHHHESDKWRKKKLS